MPAPREVGEYGGEVRGLSGSWGTGTSLGPGPEAHVDA